MNALYVGTLGTLVNQNTSKDSMLTINGKFAVTTPFESRIGAGAEITTNSNAMGQFKFSTSIEFYFSKYCMLFELIVMGHVILQEFELK